MKSPPPNVFASLDGKTKSAVTRAYNAISHKSQALVETLQAPKKSKKRKAPPKSVAMGEVREKQAGQGRVASRGGSRAVPAPVSAAVFFIYFSASVSKVRWRPMSEREGAEPRRAVKVQGVHKYRT